MSAFDRSIIATGAKVAGCRLRPFSAFHAMALLSIDSPYMHGTSAEVTPADTAVALAICRSVRSDGLSKVDRVLSFGGRVRGVFCWLFRNHRTAASQLLEHINASVEFPEVWEQQREGDKAKPSGAPWPFYLVSIMAQQLHGIDYDDLWNMPIAELICHKAIMGESHGAYQIAENDLAKIRRRRAA